MLTLKKEKSCLCHREGMVRVYLICWPKCLFHL